MNIIIHILLSAVAVFITARILPGVTLQNFESALIVAVVLGIVNGLLRPVLLILTLPINMMTLGLFTFVIIGGMVLLVDYIVPGFSVKNFWWALAFALVLSVINSFLSLFFN